MTHYFDYHIICVDRVYDDGETTTGLIKLNSGWYRVEKELDRYERKLLCGTIAAVPIGYSEKEYMPLDPGVPNPMLFIGHDAIQKQVNLGNAWGNEKYHPGLKERLEFQTIAEYGALIDAQVGEKVYFHPGVTESENLIKEEEGKAYYLAAVDQLICIVSPEGIRTQGGFVLVEPHLESEDTLLAEGLIVGLEVEVKMQEGTVRHVRQDAEMKIGDHILYVTDANYSIDIEGVTYYAMREDEITMKRV